MLNLFLNEQLCKWCFYTEVHVSATHGSILYWYKKAVETLLKWHKIGSEHCDHMHSKHWLPPGIPQKVAEL